MILEKISCLPAASSGGFTLSRQDATKHDLSVRPDSAIDVSRGHRISLQHHVASHCICTKQRSLHKATVSAHSNGLCTQQRSLHKATVSAQSNGLCSKRQNASSTGACFLTVQWEVMSDVHVTSDYARECACLCHCVAGGHTGCPRDI